MAAENLDKMFDPESIALVGASERKGSVGLTLMKNLLDREESKLYPVNPNRDTVLVHQLPEPFRFQPGDEWQQTISLNNLQLNIAGCKA